MASLGTGRSTMPAEKFLDFSGPSESKPSKAAAGLPAGSWATALVGPTLIVEYFCSASDGARKPVLAVPRMAMASEKS